MPPKGSGRGRKKVVQEKAVAKNIETYFSPTKKIPDQTTENETILNEKVVKEDSEKAGVVKLVTKQVKKRGKVGAIENGTVETVENGEVEAVENGEVEAENIKKIEDISKPVAKQGRKRAVVENISNNAETVVSNSVPTDKVATVPQKRGRKKLQDEVNGISESKLKKNNTEQVMVGAEDLDALNNRKLVENTEEIEDKSETNDVQAESPSKGKKKITAPISDETIVIEKGVDSQTKKIEDKSETNGVKAKSAGKRGRKKVAVAIPGETVVAQKSTVDKSESSNSDKPSSEFVLSKPKSKVTKSSATKLESDENKKAEDEENKDDEVTKEDEEVSTVPVKVGRKRKNVNAPAQKKGTKQNKAGIAKPSGTDTLDENKILKVSLKRSKSIDELVSEKNEKGTEKGKAAKEKPATKRKRANVGDTGTSSGSSPPKKLKEDTKSKGQSKKDKMPDVTILDFSNTSTSPTGKAWNLKIASWNVNGVRAWLEKDGLIYLKHESPDIMCIQETKCSEEKLPPEVNVEGYHSYWLNGDKDGYSGVGLLSKKEPLSVKYGIEIKEHDSEGRVITAEYEEFFLISAYVPNAGRGLVRLDYRMQWDKDFRSYIKHLDESKPVILCGDLNVAHEEIDLANPKTNKKNAGFTKEEREGFSTLLFEGFVDTFRHLYPDQKAAYTFWTYMMNARAKNVGWRLDYFVISKRFVDNLCDNAIRKDVFGSDHCPIVLFISI